MPTDQNGLLTDKTLSSIPFLTPVLMPSKFLHWKNDENWKYWDELETVKEPLKTTNKTEVLEFSVVQWNVWFDNMWLRERSEAIVKHLISLKPSIMALQEVTSTFCGILFRNPQVCEEYIVTNYQQQITETNSFYGVLVLVRKELVEACGGEVETWEVKSGNEGMKSRMGRVIVGVDLGGGFNIRFATAHFESPPSHPASRVHQFRLSSLLPTIPSNLFDSPDLTMVCGDTNCVTPDEISYGFGTAPGSRWKDAFDQIHPGENGYTFTLTYPMQHPLARLDRMMYHQVDNKWEVSKCETFGRNLEVEQREVQIGVRIQDRRGRGERVWLSDHEGVRTVFCGVRKG